MAEEALDVHREGVRVLEVVSEQHRPSHDHQLEVEHYPGVRKRDGERRRRRGGLREEEGRVQSLFLSVTGRCIGNPQRGRGSMFGSKTEGERKKEEAFPLEGMKEGDKNTKMRNQRKQKSCKERYKKNRVKWTEMRGGWRGSSP